MNNHVHLLMETKESRSLTKVMQGINLAYTIRFNRRRGKVGHLRQDRYRSVVVEREHCLLECRGYIERNALRQE
jgi:putative transposase